MPSLLVVATLLTEGLKLAPSMVVVATLTVSRRPELNTISGCCGRSVNRGPELSTISACCGHSVSTVPELSPISACCDYSGCQQRTCLNLSSFLHVVATLLDLVSSLLWPFWLSTEDLNLAPSLLVVELSTISACCGRSDHQQSTWTLHHLCLLWPLWPSTEYLNFAPSLLDVVYICMSSLNTIHWVVHHCIFQLNPQGRIHPAAKVIPKCLAFWGSMTIPLWHQHRDGKWLHHYPPHTWHQHLQRCQTFSTGKLPIPHQCLLPLPGYIFTLDMRVWVRGPRGGVWLCNFHWHGINTRMEATLWLPPSHMASTKKWKQLYDYLASHVASTQGWKQLWLPPPSYTTSAQRWKQIWLYLPPIWHQNRGWK